MSAELGQNPTHSSSRDAVHVCIVPIKPRAGHKLTPGDHFVRNHRSGDVWYVETTGDDANSDGVVDPFFEGKHVEPGDLAWGIIRPDRVEGLKHMWNHKDYEDDVGDDDDMIYDDGCGGCFS